MKVFCGTDIIEISRVKDSISSDTGDKFLERVYTQEEIEYCESKNKQKYQHYAARFSAKEAIFKAISSGLENKYAIEWTEIEIVNKDDGKPIVIIHNEVSEMIDCIDLSISHCKDYAIASAVAVFK